MICVTLYQPEIAPNTGNIIRLCANAGFALHLIEPLGFELDDRRLRRAGLDYAEWSRIRVHPSYEHYLQAAAPTRVLAFSSRGTETHSALAYQPGDHLLFGPETRGLPRCLLRAAHANLRIPMQAGSRSLNLANAVAVACYEAWRQLGYRGSSP